ncbi:MAG: hypothetical protein KAS48_07680 [Gammaproteobacteria bacterium]|nr:hypothetical protein [Gammaproteobacteria bacterium]
MMIFLTVGLHEQQFNRIVELVDNCSCDEKLIQYGYSTYKPKNSRAQQFMDMQEIRDAMEKAEVIVTHGGTGSIINALSLGKKPIVAPRYKRYGEHVDDHQDEIVMELSRRGVILSLMDGEDIEDLIKVALRHKKNIKNHGYREIESILVNEIENT